MVALLARYKKSIGYLKANKHKLFWYWVAYQAVKGAITTSFIWIPLLYVLLHET